MAKRFLVELYCDSDARSIRNMIADVIQDGFIKSVEVLDDISAQQSVQADDAPCPACGGIGGHDGACPIVVGGISPHRR